MYLLYSPNIYKKKLLTKLDYLLFINGITHDIQLLDKLEKQYYYITGHVHPCVNMKGLGKQILRFPCFYFSKQYAILPAFGKFTGGFTITPKKDTSVYAILPANHKKAEKASLLKINELMC